MRRIWLGLIGLIPLNIVLAADKADSLTFSGLNGAGLSFWAVLKIFFLLGVVILLIWAAVWALKKLSPQVASGRAGGIVRILSTTYLGPKRAFILVEVLDRIMLVGITESDIRLLAEFNDAQEVAEIRARAAGKSFPGGQFSAALSSFFQKNKQ